MNLRGRDFERAVKAVIDLSSSGSAGVHTSERRSNDPELGDAMLLILTHSEFPRHETNDSLV